MYVISLQLNYLSFCRTTHLCKLSIYLSIRTCDWYLLTRLSTYRFSLKISQ